MTKLLYNFESLRSQKYFFFKQITVDQRGPNEPVKSDSNQNFEKFKRDTQSNIGQANSYLQSSLYAIMIENPSHVAAQVVTVRV